MSPLNQQTLPMGRALELEHSQSTPLIWIGSRVNVGKVTSGTGGLPPVTGISVSPRMAWASGSPMVAQAAHAPTNVKRSTDFMGVEEVIAVGGWRDGDNGARHFDHDRGPVTLDSSQRL